MHKQINIRTETLKFVVGINIGSEYSGYAFSIYNVPPEIYIAEWSDGFGLVGCKCPTTILLDRDEEMVAFGYQAERKYFELLEDDKDHDYYYFKHVRNSIHQQWVDTTAMYVSFPRISQREDGNPMIKDVSGKPLDALKGISQIIGYFKNDAMKKIEKRFITLHGIEFFYVLTVPATWDSKEKEFMRKATIMAGIDENKHIIVTEPGAASLFISSVNSDVEKRIKKGEKYMVIQLGAITNVTCHRKCQNEIIEEIVAPIGCRWGGKSVDEAFYTFLCHICGKQIMQSLESEEPDEYANLFHDFESMKRSLRVNVENQHCIQVPFSLCNLVFQKHKTFTKAIEQSPFKEKVIFSSQRLLISPDTFRDLFVPTINSIIKHIDKVLKNPKIEDINILMVVGGFSKCIFMQDAMHSYFGQSKTIVIPEEPGSAVMKGAVLFGFQPEGNKQKVIQELRGLGLENVSDLNVLLNESSQKSYWNRIYLVGPYCVGKTCLAKLLVGETIPKTRQSTDGIWIYMGRAGMDVDKLEWVFFPKGDAIKEVLTNMLMSIAIEDKKSFTKESESEKVDTTNPKSFLTKETENTYESIDSERNDANTQYSSYDSLNIPSAASSSFKSKLKEIHSPSIERPPDFFETSFEKLTEHQESKHLSEKTETKQNNLVVTDNSECEWLEEIITDMSHDKIHQLLVKAVQEGKYKQKIVPIDIWDFGGQKDYYMTHQLFITSRGIFVLMFDGSIDLHKHMSDLCFLPGHFGKPTVAVYLLHWVNSILTYCSRTKDGFPRIIFVATHKDTKWFDWTKEARRRKLEKGLQNLFKTHTGIDHLEFKPLIFVDATNPGDQEIAQLRTILMQRAIEHPRWGEPMPTKWIPLELQLAQKSEEGMNIISRDQLTQLNSRNGEMVLSEKQLETFLKVHHSLGKLLYFDVGKLRNNIIISPAYLVEVLRSIVTEKQFWPKEKIYSTIFEELQNNGRIERDAIFRLWQQERFNHILPNKEYMLEILVHLDVIIAPSSSFEDITSSVQDVPSFLVPCMINKSNDTNFLGRFWKSNNSIILAYTFIEQVIPPALAYRFINSFVSGWKIKVYKERNKTTQMLFSDLAVIELDSCHDVAVQVRENRVIVSLIHAKTKDDIIPTLASSLQECLTVAIERISEFYSTLSEDANSQGRNHDMPFNIEFGVFCKSELCFLNHKEMQSSIWICKKHRQRHPVKYLSVWFSEKIYKGPFNICLSSCPGLGKLEKEQSPLPQHIRRIASQISPEKCHDTALELGLSESEWNDLEYQFQHQPPNDLKFTALWSCMLKRRHVTFDHIKDALKNSELSEHLLCQVFRDVIPDIPENSKDSLNKIPSFNLLHELCNHIGTRIMQIAIELDIDIPTIQRIQQEHDKKPLEQTKEVFRRWRQRSSPKPTVLGLLKALDRIGIFGTTCSVVLQFAQE